MRTIPSNRGRKGRRGFSLLEAMIAAAVLGIGLVGLAKLHVASIQGTVRSEDLSRGAEVAREIADTFATLDFANLPACGPGANSPPTWVNPWYTEDGVPDINNAAWTGDPMAGDGSAADTGNFRVDLAVSQHPDVINFPNGLTATPDQDPVQVLWIWVCWRDDKNMVQEVSTARVMTRDL
jgi:prepilin-type N-terminal cleavage/methylation domain-containing protein